MLSVTRNLDLIFKFLCSSTFNQLALNDETSRANADLFLILSVCPKRIFEFCSLSADIQNLIV